MAPPARMGSTANEAYSRRYDARGYGRLPAFGGLTRWCCLARVL